MKNKYTGLSAYGDLMQVKSEPSEALPRGCDDMGSRIKQLRVQRDLTQEELADLCGVSKAAVSHWENSKILNIGLQTFIKLLAALQSDYQYVAFGNGNGGARAPGARKNPRKSG